MMGHISRAYSRESWSQEDLVVICEPPANADQETVKRNMAKAGISQGSVYQVMRVEAGSSSTHYYLYEFPGVRFNGILFRELTKDEMIGQGA